MLSLAAVANLATTLATLFSFIYLYKKNNLKDIKIGFQRGYAKRILRVSIPISLSSILASLNRNIDSVTVVRFLKENIGEVGAQNNTLSEAKASMSLLAELLNNVLY